MLKRVIPILTFEKTRLIKTKEFQDYKYLGDVLNAMRIYNAKQVDEMILLDIGVTKYKYPINYELLSEIASEAFMPLTYGGGVQSVEQIGKILSLGYEKVCFNTLAYTNPAIIKEAAEMFGAQSLVVSINTKMMPDKTIKMFYSNGKFGCNFDIIEFCQEMEDLGVGEILLMSIDRDNSKEGYDIDLLNNVVNKVNVPIIMSGGLGSIKDINEAFISGACAAAGSAFFSLIGKLDAPLISYPSASALDQLHVSY